MLGGGPASNKSANEVSGFLVHHIYVASASWPTLLTSPTVRVIILRRTNIVKRTISNMLRVAEDEDEDDTPVGDKMKGTLDPHQKQRRTYTVEPKELVRLAKLSLLSLLRMPSGIDFFSDEHYLILYEDLQNQRAGAHR